AQSVVNSADDTIGPFAVTQMGAFNEPWAMAFEPGTGNLFISEKKGAIQFLTPSGSIGEVSGVPQVAYGGQGGLGDFVFAPDYTTSRRIYLSWVERAEEPNPENKRRAVVGMGKLNCTSETKCAIEGLKAIWRQEPAIASFGHFSHRIAFSPDGAYLFVTSGERMQGAPAQDLSNNLGKVVRLLPDGTPAPGNPFASRGGVSAQIWSYGHRNLLGIKFDNQGRLWELEHGPAGGDELNLVEPGKNYGWPVVSDGDDYSGTSIPRHTTRPDFAAPALSWNPVIAPGDFIFYSGSLFPKWRGNVLIAGLKTQALVRVAFDGDKPREVERIDLGMRLRDVEQGPDGAIWVVGDGPGGKLLKLTPKE
ncbi:MAG TPA: PQQ-dependent sugar dehydrogenase, partial [Devosia sp.]|nr:PQQ-dependent sugar dehydrogenase [Devosia sp.]